MKFGEGINVVYDGHWPPENLNFAKRVIDKIPLTVECDEDSRSTGQTLDILVSRKNLSFGHWGIKLSSEGPVIYSGIEHIPSEAYSVSYLIANQKNFFLIRDKSSGTSLSIE